MKKTFTQFLAALMLLVNKAQKLMISKTYTRLLVLLYLLFFLTPVLAQERIFNFGGGNGKTPYSSLIQGQDGYLYGTTPEGGWTFFGTIFRVNTDGTGYTLLHQFAYDQNANDGIFCYGSLIQATNGYLYGMTIASGHGGTENSGTIFRLKPDGSEYATLLYFHGLNGSFPISSLMQGADSLLYGMTPLGGSSYGGTIFKINAEGTEETILHNFDFFSGSSPNYTSLVQGADGTMYGLTNRGGAYDKGIIFKIKTDGSGYTILNNFNGTNGKSPNGSLIFGKDGMLYGMTSEGGVFNSGTIFKIMPDGTEHTLLHNFNNLDGTYPQGSLIQLQDGSFRGMTHSGGLYNVGTIFKINADGTGYSVLVNFHKTTGTNPYGSLIQATDGNLYGMTSGGGSSGYGSIFRITPLAIQAPAVAPGGITFHDVLSTSMNVSFTPGSGPHRLVVMKAGSAPTFLPKDDTFYEGDLGNGESVAYNGSDSLFNVSSLQSNTEYFFKFFEFNTDSVITRYMVADVPVVSSRTLQKRLLGVISSGGSAGYGTLVSVHPDGTDFTVLHNFDLPTGGSPMGSLIQAPDGAIFGVTYMGGTSIYGTIFKINADGTDHTILHSFTYTDGAFPVSHLTLAADGSLFGMTIDGGSRAKGTIFKINSDGSGFTVLHHFNGSDGASPNGSLIQASDGSFFGMTRAGGPLEMGAIFKINSDGSDYTILHNFNKVDGYGPVGSLIHGLDGSLFGMTYGGGSLGYGTIFKIGDDGSDYSVLFEFNKANGSHPLGSLVQISDGSLFGMTYQGGSSDLGTIFKINANGSDHTVLHNFIGIDGATPQGGSLIIFDHKLFGFTSLGGVSNSGVIFSYNLESSTYNKFRDLSSSSGARPQYAALLLIGGEPEPLLDRPTLQASNISFSNVLSTSMTMTFNPGNGNRRLAIMKPGGAPTLRPVDNTKYSGALGHGEVVIADGKDYTLNIKGLQSYRTYYFTVFEYILDSIGNIKYIVDNAPVKNQRTRILPDVYLIKPGNGAVDQYVSITLKAKSVSGAANYKYEVSTDPNFVNPKIVNGGNIQLIDSLHYNTLYYAHVKTNLRDDYGKVTTFTTRTAESLAYVTSPANGAVDVSTKTAIASNPVPYASEYTIQLSETNDFSVVAFEATGSSRILHFPELKSNTTYYSRVRVNLSLVFGGVRSFTTRNAMAAARTATDSETELSEFALTVYPNPFQEKLMLYIESSRYDEAKITLMDLTGRTVHEFSGKTNSPLEIERSLVNGVYLLRINAGGSAKQVRVVKIQ